MLSRVRCSGSARCLRCRQMGSAEVDAAFGRLRRLTHTEGHNRHATTHGSSDRGKGADGEERRRWRRKRASAGLTRLAASPSTPPSLPSALDLRWLSAAPPPQLPLSPSAVWPPHRTAAEGVECARASLLVPPSAFHLPLAPSPFAVRLHFHPTTATLLHSTELTGPQAADGRWTWSSADGAQPAQQPQPSTSSTSSAPPPRPARPLSRWSDFHRGSHSNALFLPQRPAGETGEEAAAATAPALRGRARAAAAHPIVDTAHLFPFDEDGAAAARGAERSSDSSALLLTAPILDVPFHVVRSLDIDDGRSAPPPQVQSAESASSAHSAQAAQSAESAHPAPYGATRRWETEPLPPLHPTTASYDSSEEWPQTAVSDVLSQQTDTLSLPGAALPPFHLCWLTARCSLCYALRVPCV